MKQALYGRSLGKANTKHSKMTCQFQLDFGHGTMYNGKRCRVQMDIGPIKVKKGWRNSRAVD
jgi:hypothetical protein